MSGRMLSERAREGLVLADRDRLQRDLPAAVLGRACRGCRAASTSTPTPDSTGYNVVSTIGSFVLAIGVLVTVVNVVRSRKGTRAGPDPWRANTLEWFTPSPPPEHNFDVIPRVRSVEPMKDIRRRVEQETGTSSATRRAAAQPASSRWRRPAQPPGSRRRRCARARQAVRRLLRPDEAAGPDAAAVDDDHDDVRGRRPVARPRRLTCLGGSLSAGGAGAINHWFDRDIDAQHGADGEPAGARRGASRPRTR